MSVKQWSEDTISYDLNGEWTIRRAEPGEWGVYCSVYYNMQYNGFFREEVYTNPRRNAFWIYKGESRIGGVRMSPNVIYHLFVIPPFNDSFGILKQLKKLLIQWSDQKEPIRTYEVLPDQVHLYARAGFWPDEFRCRWMQRPTELFQVDWEDDLRIESPEVEGTEAGGKRFILAEEIARCDFESFRGGLDATRRKQFALEDFVPGEDPNYSNEILTQASTLVFDNATDQLIANCRLCLQDQVAAVYSIGVNPAYRGRGLATKMLQRALTMLKGTYPLLRLYVMEGNDAESVYYNLGFKPGVQEVQKMYIPVN
ncbi:GNAT family N-acetyltransferase [Paenibacillus silagei]|uniref:Ribosomal protein S18 acetylase RimI-like enzyme n=1 Tax=Paenibacillus silagei TaxID=1670801 RepID=A0ABS4P1E8_9BACL|nr:GNAT family N-acetyltransferase [Paenibacillus silagei]MBP2116114.1 ribosomal protein S18 acetylase RimI-like enzyme [Paenibacillus silagei]